MRLRTFGRVGWQVGEIGYGMWGLAGWTGSDDAETMRSLERAVDLGCNFFDTAWAYGDGHSEGLLGQLVRSHPDRRLYVASKIPPKNQEWPPRAGARLGGGLPAGSHSALHRVQPEEPWAGDDRLDSIPCLAGRLGRGRPAGSGRSRT